MVPVELAVVTAAGIAWRRSNTTYIEGPVEPFTRVELRYGDLETGRSRAPYDRFGVE